VLSFENKTKEIVKRYMGSWNVSSIEGEKAEDTFTQQVMNLETIICRRELVNPIFQITK
jgi:hypothetical protein